MTKKIIVIGAGIAGLAASHDLRDAGFDVMILEARHRVGGRIYTGEIGRIPVNLGAAWIHGTDGNPIDRQGKTIAYSQRTLLSNRIRWL